MDDQRDEAGDKRKRWKAARDAVRAADKKAMRIAARQWGALTRQQALAAGLTRNQIAYRVQTGQWLQPVRGVFVVAGVPRCWEQSLMIACLTGPVDTAASHLSAAALFGLAKPPDVPQVTIPSRASGRFKGALIYRAALGTGDTCIRRNIRCTNPTRTVVDCAAAGLVTGEALWDLVGQRAVQEADAAVPSPPGQRTGLEGVPRATPGPARSS